MGSFPKSQPLFVSLAQQLRRRIASDEWPQGSRLPTEREIAKSDAVGINTVRRAVGILVEEGWVTRRQGSGMYVTGRPTRPARATVGVIVPSESYYFPPIIEGATQIADAAGIVLRVTSSDYDDALEMRRIRELVASGVSGILIAPTLHMADPTARLDLLRTLPIPVVLLERHPVRPAPDDALSYISTDVVAGGYAAVRHLAQRGRRRIGFLGRSDTATAGSVWEGYRRAIDDLRLEHIDPAVARRPEWSPPALSEFAATVLEERLDGLLCLGDREAMALLPWLRSGGIVVPDRLAIVTYDDEEAAIASVPLSAVSPPKREIGRLAASTLLQQIAQGAERGAVRTLLQPTVRVRMSSA